MLPLIITTILILRRTVSSFTASGASCFDAALALDQKDDCVIQIPIWIPYLGTTEV
jgi:hypothetical protein